LGRVFSRAKICKFWWLSAAFLVPFFVYLVLSRESLFVAARSGLIGLIVACIIYVLWKIDYRLTAPTRPDSRADVLIMILGILLWLAWFSTGQMIFIANDEVNGSASNQGFEVH